MTNTITYPRAIIMHRFSNIANQHPRPQPGLTAAPLFTGVITAEPKHVG